MLKINILRFLFISCFLFTNYCTEAQQNWLPCGNVRIDTIANTLAKNYLLDHRDINSSAYAIRVYFHIFAYNDGTNPAATPAEVESEFASLLASYSAANICFIKMGVQYINNSSLDTNFNADTDPNGTALNSYQIPGCINIFYMRQIKGNNTACSPPCGYGGIALGGIPGTFFLVASGNIGSSNTIGHEMGHSLGLLHTFEFVAGGVENINGSNATYAGDQITDTPADPFVWNGLPCYSATACNYTGTCADPNGATNYTPPYTNLMSYWGSPCGNPVATNGQFTRAYSFLNTYSPLLNCGSPSSLTINPVTVSSGRFDRTAINTITTIGNVIINNTTVATIVAGKTTLSPNFKASPTGGGRTHIFVSSCN